MKREEHLEMDHLEASWESRIRGDSSGKKLLKPPIRARSPIQFREMQKSCKVGLPIDRSLIQFREATVENNVGLPIDSSPIQFRKATMGRRGPTMKTRGPDGAANLPEPYQILLRDGMKHLFLLDGGAWVRVHDWVFVCISSDIPTEMVTREGFELFIKDLVCKCEAIGMDICPHPRFSLWPIATLNGLAELLRSLESSGKMVQFVLVVLPDAVLMRNHSRDDSVKNILLFCKNHGIIFLDCASSHVMMRSEELMCLNALRIKDQAEYLDYLKKTGGDSKASVLRNEIDEIGHYVKSGREIGRDGGSGELLDVHASGSPNVSTQEDDSSDKKQGGDGGSVLCKNIDDNRCHVDSGKEIGGVGGSKELLDVPVWGSPNVSDDDTQESLDKEQGGDDGSEHEKSTHRDGFPGSVEEAESEDVLPKESGGSVDLMESIDCSTLQVNEKGNVRNWAYISFSMSEKETTKFLRKLLTACIDMGMGFYPMPTRYDHVKPRSSNDVEDTLWHMHDKISEVFSAHGKEIGLLLVILPDKRVGDEIYGKSEKVCEKLGYVYQCCSPKDATNPSEVYLKKTADEINNKVLRRDAACNFVMPFSAIDDDPTIVFGADIFRDSNISIASVVSTIDWPVSSRYNCIVAEQPCKEVTIKNLHNENKVRESMVRSSLLIFARKTKKLPCRIIFFRNGVDEGQLSFILSQEIDAIQKACTSLFTSMLPITYVVVGRAESAVSEDSSTKFEFSCCHPVAGETRTVTYRVLHDENEYDADELQSICTNLCTNRVRWAQPEVSMAPPAYYAHIAASRAHAHFAASQVN